MDDDKKGGFYMTDDDFAPSDSSDEIAVKFISKNTPADDEDDEISKIIEENYSDGDESGEEKKNNFSVNPKLLIAVACIVIIGVVCAVVFPKIKTEFQNSNAQSNTADAVNAILDIQSDKVIQFDEFENGATVLSDDEIDYIFTSGTVKTNTHSYINPCVKVSGDYVLLFDRGKTDYRCEKNGSIQNTSVAENGIITADITAKGAYAVSFLGKSCTSILSVYSSGGKEVFRWECSDYYISEIALSPNGQKVCVVLISSKNGGLSSIVKIFDIDYNSEYATFELEDVAVSAKWFSSKKLLLAGKSGIYYINKDSILNVYPFNSDYIEYYDFAGDRLYVLSMSNSDSTIHNVIAIGANGKVKFSTPVKGKVRSFSATDKYSCVLTSDSIVSIDRSGDSAGKTDNVKYTVDVVSHSKCNYVLGVNGIYKFSAYGNAKAEKTEQITGVDQIEKE